MGRGLTPKKTNMKDPYGEAIKAYFEGDTEASITVESDLAETDVWPVSEFFHSWDTMGPLERRAMSLASGRVLDVGAGSGSHSLWLQRHGVDVEAVEISPLAANVIRDRGVKKVTTADFFAFETAKRYDTLLMLMNGAGLAGTLQGLDRLLAKAKGLLAPGGQILVDSSDLLYLYEEEDGSYALPIGGRYYGELEYVFEFRGVRSEAFPWVFADQASLADAAERNGLSFTLVAEGEHYDYLARLAADEI